MAVGAAVGLASARRFNTGHALLTRRKVRDGPGNDPVGQFVSGALILVLLLLLLLLFVVALAAGLRLQMLIANTI